jgi:hypothetical protein
MNEKVINEEVKRKIRKSIVLERRTVHLPGKTKLNGEQIERRRLRHERDKKILELKLSGVRYDDIARLMHVSNSTVEKAISRAIVEYSPDEVESLVKQDLMRLESYRQRATAALNTGDITQIDRLIRIMFAIRATLGIGDDYLADQRNRRQSDRTGVTNNGVMVIQTGNSTSEYISKLMKATGADDKAITAELKRMEDRQRSKDSESLLPAVPEAGVTTPAQLNNMPVLPSGDLRAPSIQIQINTAGNVAREASEETAGRKIKIKRIAPDVNERTIIRAPRKIKPSYDVKEEIIDVEYSEDEYDHTVNDDGTVS